jgi:hypothetical protein
MGVFFWASYKPHATNFSLQLEFGIRRTFQLEGETDDQQIRLIRHGRPSTTLPW